MGGLCVSRVFARGREACALFVGGLVFFYDWRVSGLRVSSFVYDSLSGPVYRTYLRHEVRACLAKRVCLLRCVLT